jgi:hypothetical protein
MFPVNLVLEYHNLSIQSSDASVQTQIFQRRTSSPLQGYWDISIPWGWRRCWSLKRLCVWTIWRGCKPEKVSTEFCRRERQRYRAQGLFQTFMGRWWCYAPPAVIHSTFCPHSLFMYFTRLSQYVISPNRISKICRYNKEIRRSV